VPVPLRRLVESSFAAVEAKDLAAVLATFADDAELDDPHYPNPHMVGKAAIADGLRWAFGGMKQFGFTIVNYCESASGDVVAVEVDTHHILKTGMHLRFPQAFFIQIRDGRIARMQAYVPYGPHGIAGAVLALTRFKRKLSR
jgi:ketosteroid isomerase-like protein